MGGQAPVLVWRGHALQFPGERQVLAIEAAAAAAAAAAFVGSGAGPHLQPPRRVDASSSAAAGKQQLWWWALQLIINVAAYSRAQRLGPQHSSRELQRFLLKVESFCLEVDGEE